MNPGAQRPNPLFRLHISTSTCVTKHSRAVIPQLSNCCSPLLPPGHLHVQIVDLATGAVVRTVKPVRVCASVCACGVGWGGLRGGSRGHAGRHVSRVYGARGVRGGRQPGCRAPIQVAAGPESQWYLLPVPVTPTRPPTHTHTHTYTHTLSLPPQDGEAVTALALSPDSRTLVVATRSLYVRVYDMYSGGSSSSSSTGSAATADAAGSSSSSGLGAGVGEEVPVLKPLRSWRAHKLPVADLAVDASGGYVATASADKSVKVGWGNGESGAVEGGVHSSPNATKPS